jgi:Putative zincin peptidase
MVGLAPLILITSIGFLLVPITPDNWLLMLGVAVTANASGAVGDLAVVLWLLIKHPADLLLRDRGDAIDIYHSTIT